MKKTIGYWAVCAMTALVATTFVACGEKESSAAGGGTGEKLWKSETKEYKNFTDLGNYWLHNDDNFEAAKALAYSQIHIRYNDNGEFDMNSMSKYDKLLAFYGMGVEKDEKPLRDDGHIWTTSLNVGVNCAQKEMKIRFWENDEVIYHFKW